MCLNNILWALMAPKFKKFYVLYRSCEFYRNVGLMYKNLSIFANYYAFLGKIKNLNYLNIWKKSNFWAQIWKFLVPLSAGHLATLSYPLLEDENLQFYLPLRLKSLKYLVIKGLQNFSEAEGVAFFIKNFPKFRENALNFLWLVRCRKRRHIKIMSSKYPLFPRGAIFLKYLWIILASKE